MTFKSKDGVYILAHASADFGYDKVKEVSDYQSDWTKEDFDKLTVGTQADLLKGIRLQMLSQTTLRSALVRMS